MNLKPLLDFIGKLEANGNYNAIYGNARAADLLSDYTLAQILVKQYRHGRLTGSSAHGKYQFIRKTLKSLIDQMDLDRDQRFTPSLQDEMAEQLIIGRGLHKWLDGRWSDAAFMDSLSKEWASLPYRTGASYYDGDGMNHALATRSEFLDVLKHVRGSI